MIGINERGNESETLTPGAQGVLLNYLTIACVLLRFCVTK